MADRRGLEGAFIGRFSDKEKNDICCFVNGAHKKGRLGGAVLANNRQTHR